MKKLGMADCEQSHQWMPRYNAPPALLTPSLPLALRCSISPPPPPPSPTHPQQLTQPRCYRHPGVGQSLLRAAHGRRTALEMTFPSLPSSVDDRSNLVGLLHVGGCFCNWGKELLHDSHWWLLLQLGRRKEGGGISGTFERNPNCSCRISVLEIYLPPLCFHIRTSKPK